MASRKWSIAWNQAGNRPLGIFEWRWSLAILFGSSSFWNAVSLWSSWIWQCCSSFNIRYHLADSLIPWGVLGQLCLNLNFRVLQFIIEFTLPFLSFFGFLVLKILISDLELLLHLWSLATRLWRSQQQLMIVSWWPSASQQILWIHGT